MAKTKEVETKKTTKADRMDILKQISASIKSKHGDEAIMMSHEVKNIETISSGSLALDLALGKGFPEGRIIELYGQEASGKTTTTLAAIAEQQKAGKVCAFIDAEHALDPEYAKRVGVNMEELLIVQPDYGEQALQIAEDLINTGMVGCIVIDSVAALTPKDELEGDIEKQQMGLQARMMSKACRKLTAIAQTKKCTVFFINQIREKIGVMFGNPQTTSGGNALKYYASVRLSMLSGQKVYSKETGELVGGTLKVKVVKNKVAAPFQVAEVPIVTGQGYDTVADVLTVARKLFANATEEDNKGFRFSGGHHWLYGQELEKDKLGSSLDKSADVLRENPKMLKFLEKLVRDEFEARRVAKK